MCSINFMNLSERNTFIGIVSHQQDTICINIVITGTTSIKGNYLHILYGYIPVGVSVVIPIGNTDDGMMVAMQIQIVLFGLSMTYHLICDGCL